MKEGEVVRVVCAGCGSHGEGHTVEEAWNAVPHEGHLHKAERMSAEKAEKTGWLELVM